MKTLFYFNSRLIGFIWLLLLLFIGGAGTSLAATFTVTNTDDSSTGSLRAAIIAANSNNEDDRIVFDPAVFNTPQTIILTSGELRIEPDSTSSKTRLLTIDGPGANLLTISGNDQSRIFLIAKNSQAVINGVKITGGKAPDIEGFPGSGGGIKVEGSSDNISRRNLLLTNSIVSDNKTTNGYTEGGGIEGGGDVVIMNSAIFNNSTSAYGGGIDGDTVWVINSTVSHNTAHLGGGIYNGLTSTLYLINSTVAFNEAKGAGGVGVSPSGGKVYMRNSIVAKNKADDEYGVDIGGDIDSYENYYDLTRRAFYGNNIIGNPSGVYFSNYGNQNLTNQLGVDPQLDPELKLNGGVIPTHALRINSPAIDKGDNCILKTIVDGGCSDVDLTTDARGIHRPQDGDSNGAALVDIGAFEASEEESSLAPNIPDLAAASDTGISSSDNITNSRNLSFSVRGVVAGSTVEIFRDDVKVGSLTPTNGTINFADNDLPADGQFHYSCRQIVNNITSLKSPVLTVTIDNTLPNVTLNQAVEQPDPAKNPSITYTAVFDEEITGFDSKDVSLAGSTANVSVANIGIGAVTGKSKTFNVTVGNIAGDGTVQAAILPNAVEDLAGNKSTGSTSTDNTVSLDTVAPIVVINQASNQADPAKTSPVNFTVIFSEPVTDFTKDDVLLSGSTANLSTASIIVTGSGTNYNVAVSNFNSNGQTVKASIRAQAAADAAGNANVASTSQDNTVTVDNMVPTVTINQAAGQADPTSISQPINYTVVFSEPVTGFDVSDISVSGTSISTSSGTITITGSGPTYNVNISGLKYFSGDINGFLKLSVNFGAVTDAVGNSNSTSTSTDNLVRLDDQPPFVTINQAVGQSDPAIRPPLNFTVVFSELVTGFDSSDVSLAGSTANVSSANITVTGSGQTYNVAVTNIASSGEVRASVKENAVLDAAGNLSRASTSTDSVVTLNIPQVRKKTVGVFRSSNGITYLKNSNTGGVADINMVYGVSGDKSFAGDWDGDGVDSMGIYRNGVFYLRNSNTTGPASMVFAFGSPGDQPIAGDWNGDGIDTIGIYRPSNGLFLLRNSNSAGEPDLVFVLGNPGDVAIAGDWDGDGITTTGVFRPTNGIVYLKNTNQSGNADIYLVYGVAGDKPLAGDWDGDGKDSIGIYRNGVFYLRNSNTQGFADMVFALGNPGDEPIAGDWDGQP